jgi:pyridoxal 5'-phosphate synthase pdxS subunit
MMQMGGDGVFVGSGIFKSSDPPRFARAIVEAVNHFDEPAEIAKAAKGLGEPMKGIEMATLSDDERLQARGV